MDLSEFKKEVYIVFRDLPQQSTYGTLDLWNVIYFNHTLYLHIATNFDYIDFVLLEMNNTTYKIDRINTIDYTEIFDDIVIFKELILPKYL